MRMLALIRGVLKFCALIDSTHGIALLNVLALSWSITSQHGRRQ
jgi:hypothetical protein